MLSLVREPNMPPPRFSCQPTEVYGVGQCLVPDEIGHGWEQSLLPVDEQEGGFTGF